MKKKLFETLCTLLLLGAAPPATTEEEDVDILLELPAERSRVLSADGPRAGEDAVSLGVAIFATTPTFDMRYVRGVSEHVAFEGALSTNGAFQRLRLSGRYRLSEGSDGGALALRLSAIEIHDMARPAQLIAGVGPGLMLSFGETIHYTIACDVAWSFLEAGDLRNDGRGIQFHPAIGAELAISDEMHVFAEGALLIALSDDLSVLLPVISAGLVW